MKRKREERRGIVFTIDAVFAIYLGLLFLTTYFLVLEPYYTPVSNLNYLNRMARDFQEARYYYRQGIVPATEQMNPEQYGFSTLCPETKDTGAAKVLDYASIRDYGYDKNVRSYVPRQVSNNISDEELMLYPYANKWLYAGLYTMPSDVWYTEVTQACVK